MTQKTIRFKRNTHDEQGHWKDFPAGAWHFWNQYGSSIGELLLAEAGLTLDEVILAWREYTELWPEEEEKITDEWYISWILLRLAGSRPISWATM